MIFRKIFTEKRNSEEYYELFNSDDIDIKEFGKDALSELKIIEEELRRALEIERNLLC